MTDIDNTVLDGLGRLDDLRAVLSRMTYQGHLDGSTETSLATVVAPALNQVRAAIEKWGSRGSG